MLPGPGPHLMRGFASDPSVTRQQLKPGTVRRIAGYARPYRWDLTVFLLAAALDAVITVTIPVLLGVVIDKGVLPKSFERPLYTTFLASTFRSIRFGVNEAHGKGIALQLNHLLDQGAVTVRPDGTFAVNPSKIKDGVAALTREIMTIQAEGSYAKAKALGDRLGVVRPPVKAALDRLTAVPVDIEPRFTTAERLVAEANGRPIVRPAPRKK